MPKKPKSKKAEAAPEGPPASKRGKAPQTGADPAPGAEPSDNAEGEHQAASEALPKRGKPPLPPKLGRQGSSIWPMGGRGGTKPSQMLGGGKSGVPRRGGARGR
jgi:hypothetical protein